MQNRGSYNRDGLSAKQKEQADATENAEAFASLSAEQLQRYEAERETYPSAKQTRAASAASTPVAPLPQALDSVSTAVAPFEPEIAVVDLSLFATTEQK